jgi:hypothetical protein
VVYAAIGGLTVENASDETSGFDGGIAHDVYARGTKNNQIQQKRSAAP